MSTWYVSLPKVECDGMNELDRVALSTETFKCLLCFSASDLPGIGDVVLLSSAASASVATVVSTDNLTLSVAITGV